MWEFPLKTVHIVGIGGVGVSAIAEMLLSFGVKVQGSDALEGANTRRLEVKGIKIFIGHRAENIEGADCVVASTAVPEDNPELMAARKKGLPVGRRSEILAEILRYKQGICVSGSHGKTTTSSLIAHILKETGMHPNCIIGGILNSCQSNAICDTGPYLVVEADESDETFLKLPTTISVVTNINPEHIVYHYGSYEKYKGAFELFVRNTAFYGYSVLCIDHPEVKKIYQTVKERRLISYGFDETANISAKNVQGYENKTTFDVILNLPDHKETWKDVTLSLIGKHNVQNALAAIAVSLALGLEKAEIVKALSCFMGVQRRLTKRAEIGGVKIFDDYAVHPVEIKTTLKAVKDITKGKVIAVFQPHRYTRMADVWDDFMTAFGEADTVVVADIYACGEKPIARYTQDKMIEQMSKHHKNVLKLEKLTDLADMIKKTAKSGDTVICLGAGTISAACKEAVAMLEGEK